MKNLLYLLSAALGLFLASCSSDDPLYDNSDQTWKVFVSRSDSLVNKLSLYKETDGEVVYDDIYQQVNGKTLPGQVAKIAVFGDEIYLLIPSAYKIICLNRWTYKESGIIDFTSLNLEPNDICFMNATTAYVVHTNANSISVVDLKYYVAANQINVGTAPVRIVTSGYNVVVANSKSNNLSIIDSRTNAKIMDFPVADYPYYLDVNSFGNVTAICMGKGKLDTTETKTAAYIYELDMNTKTSSFIGELKYSVLNSINQIPNGIAISDKDMAFITTNEGMFLFNTRTLTGPVLVSKGAHKCIAFNKIRSELVLVKSINNIISGHTASNSNGKTTGDIYVPNDLITILPM